MSLQTTYCLSRADILLRYTSQEHSYQFKDDSIFREWDTSEAAEPGPRKLDSSHVIYQSRPFHRKKGWRGFGMPLLSDFGEARLGDVHNGLIQPDIYRAPEVILGMSWTSKVDIWNVGALVCEG